MKHYGNILMVLALTMLGTSCVKEQLRPEEQQGDCTILGLSLDEYSKTYLGEGISSRPILWHSGDQIIANGEHIGTVGPEYDGKKSASIAIESFISGPYEVLYPASALNSDGSITISQSQEFVNNSIADGVALAAGYSDSDNVNMHCLFGFVKFTIQRHSSEQIKSLVLSCASGEALSGLFSLDYQSTKLSVRSGKDFIRIEHVQYNSEGKAEVIAALPAGKYSGLRLRIISDAASGNNLMQGTISATSLTVKPATLVDLGNFAFNPNSRACEILTATDLQNFLNVASGDFSAWKDAKSGEVLLGCDIDCSGVTLTPASSFNGIFNGQGYRLKNLHLSKEIFTSNSGTIKNVIFDKSCSFTIPDPTSKAINNNGFLVKANEAGGSVLSCVSEVESASASYNIMTRNRFGILVGHSSGVVSNCVNYTDIKLTVSSFTYGAPNIGGIVGCQTGEVKCENNINYGDITVTGSFETKINGYFAGVFGCNYNDIENCRNYGNVTLTNNTGKVAVHPLFYLGGITGAQLKNGTIRNCQNFGKVSLISGLSSATILNRPYVGGITGTTLAREISSCLNEGKITVKGHFRDTTITAAQSPSIGGIAGNNSDPTNVSLTATMSNNINRGDIEFTEYVNATGNSRIGGIAGIFNGTVSNCTNEGNISVPESGRFILCGGIAGVTTAGSICNITNCFNSGTMELSTAGGGNSTLISGGILGRSQGSVVANCENSGDISNESGDIDIGGICGHMKLVATNQVSYCTNHGKVKAHTTVDGCRAGGIVGYTDKAANTEYSVTNCVNEGELDIKLGADAYYRIGGIVGYGSMIILTGNENRGKVSVDTDDGFSSTSTQYIGGILGFAASGYDYKEVRNCTNYGRVEDLGTGKVRIGGILGYSNTALTSSSLVSYGDIYVKRTAKATQVGGIVGYCNKDISGCIVKCSLKSDSPNNVLVGSVAGSFANDTGATFYDIDINCTLSTNTATVIKPGAIIGEQNNTTSTITFGTSSYPILINPATSINGAQITSPVQKSQLVGNIKAENLITISNVTVSTPSSSLCSYSASSTVIPGKGTSAGFSFTIQDEACSFTTPACGWIELASSNPKEGNAHASVKLDFNALANLGPAAREYTIRISGKSSGKYQDITFTQENGDWLLNTGTTYALPARWLCNGTLKSASSTLWPGSGYFPTYQGGASTSKTGGYISLVHTDLNQAAHAVERNFHSSATNCPIARSMGEGDYWLVTIPSVSCEADSYFSLYLTMGGNKKSPKYFVFEYWDEDQWKQNPDRLHTASENAALAYSYKTPGTIVTTSGQYVTFDETFKISKALNNENIYVRMRAVGQYAADGTTLNVTNVTDSESSFAPSAFVGAYLYKMPSSTRPAIKKKLLFIGNSFTYYQQSVAKLKQLAWSQGVELDVQAFFKGGQTFAQHLNLSQSTFTVKLGGYDYALLQDQSNAIADVGYNYSSYKGNVTNYKTLADLVRSYSPGVKILLENCWASQSNSDASHYPDSEVVKYFGTVNVENRRKLFDMYAQQALPYYKSTDTGLTVSPVNEAFATARNGCSINLFHTDNHHPSNEGAYLKTCVNCLMITGKPFDSNAITMDGISESNAAILRGFAETATGIK